MSNSKNRYASRTNRAAMHGQSDCHSKISPRYSIPRSEKTANPCIKRARARRAPAPSQVGGRSRARSRCSAMLSATRWLGVCGSLVETMRSIGYRCSAVYRLASDGRSHPRSYCPPCDVLIDAGPVESESQREEQLFERQMEDEDAGEGIRVPDALDIARRGQLEARE